MTKLHERYKVWEDAALTPLLQKSPERYTNFTSTSNFSYQRLAIPQNNISSEQADDYLDRIGFPGEYPFTRGVVPTMFRGRFWTMRQYAGFATAAETNERYKYLLEQGQTGLSVAFDLPTQMGYDSDHERSLGEVGKVGVAIDSIEDMRTLFKGIPLDKVTTSMTINAPAGVLLAMYQAVAEENGASADQLGGTIQNDILKEYMARGTFIFPPRPSIALTVDTFLYCTAVLPKWNSISISGYHIREAGCSAAQEIAFTLADGVYYAEQAIKAGLDINKFGRRLSFFFNAHNNFLEEVAKFRAARRLWAKLTKNRLKATHPDVWKLRFHTQTAGSMLTAQQPLVNISRVALQALAAVLGGTQSLHTNSYDEALALPSEESARIALRTQQVIAYESGVCDTVDALAGSYFIEDLTDKLEAEAEQYISKIDEMGGMLAAIEKGYPQREIQAKAYEWQKGIEKNERVVVGVNKFTIAEEEKISLRAAEAEAGQRESLEKFKANRRHNYSECWEPALGEVKRAGELAMKRMEAVERGESVSALEPKETVCAAYYNAVKAGATLGEIISSLESLWGRHRG